MGGENETVSKQKVENSTGGTEVIGSVRYHTSKGEVHFHDDTRGMKVAIPVGQFAKAWQTLMSECPNHWNYVDTVNQTILHLEIRYKKANPDKGRANPIIDVLLNIEKISMTEEFKKLNQFSLK